MGASAMACMSITQIECPVQCNYGGQTGHLTDVNKMYGSQFQTPPSSTGFNPKDIIGSPVCPYKIGKTGATFYCNGVEALTGAPACKQPAST